MTFPSLYRCSPSTAYSYLQPNRAPQNLHMTSLTRCRPVIMTRLYAWLRFTFTTRWNSHAGPVELTKFAEWRCSMLVSGFEQLAHSNSREPAMNSQNLRPITHTVGLYSVPLSFSVSAASSYICSSITTRHHSANKTIQPQLPAFTDLNLNGS